MKYLIIAILLFIPLQSQARLIIRGDYTPEQIEIVEKYSMFYSEDVEIWYVREFKNKNCGSTIPKKTATGCTYWMGNTPFRIELLNDPFWNQFNENSLAHELGHYFFRSNDEDFVIRYANMMTSWVNSLMYN